MREQFIVWIDDEPWSCKEFQPYQNYLCETDTQDPPFSCKNIARYELVNMADRSPYDEDETGRLYLCEECLEKLKSET
jgi:hypothetical protein